MEKEKHIACKEETKYKFDKLQLDLKHKKVLRTKDELINLMINITKEYFKEKFKDGN